MPSNNKPIALGFATGFVSALVLFYMFSGQTNYCQKVWNDDPADVFKPLPPASSQGIGTQGATVIEANRKIALQYGKEFVSDKFWFHDYAAMYEKHLMPYASRPQNKYKLFEMGVAKRALGQLFLSTYAPHIEYYGFDLANYDWGELPESQAERKAFLKERVMPGRSMANAADLKLATDKWGPFDFIVDDGSHMTPHIKFAFLELFPSPALKPGGTYCIEDLEHVFQGEDRHNLKKRETAMHFIMNLFQSLTFPFHWNYGKMGIGMTKESALPVYKVAESIRSIDCDRAVCCITKVDTEGGKHKWKSPCGEEQDPHKPCPFPPGHMAN